jgi:hypothetical protein
LHIDLRYIIEGTKGPFVARELESTGEVISSSILLMMYTFELLFPKSYEYECRLEAVVRDGDPDPASARTYELRAGLSYNEGLLSAPFSAASAVDLERTIPEDLCRALIVKLVEDGVLAAKDAAATPAE